MSNVHALVVITTGIMDSQRALVAIFWNVAEVPVANIALVRHICTEISSTLLLA